MNCGFQILKISLSKIMLDDIMEPFGGYMNRINSLFDSLDDWRNLPSYQLERRADIFFSLYLAEVLKKKRNIDIDSRIIPEFPVIKRTKDKDNNTRQSFKVD